MTPSRVHLSFAIVLSLATGPALAADQIVLPGTSYTITFPGSPECDTDPEAVKLPMGFPASCSIEVDGLKYSFDYMVLPYEIPSDQAESAMFAVALGHATAVGGDIEEKQLGKVAGFPSMDFAISAKDRGPIGYGRYVIVRTHMVRAVVESTGESITRESADEVLSSIVIE